MHIHLVQFIIGGLKQDRHIQFGLNSAIVRGFERQGNGIDSQLVQLRQDLVACINAGRRAKQGATADDNA